MTERQDVTDRILSYLAGDAERPTFDDLDAEARVDALTQLEGLEAALIDDEMIPSFADDPVAVKLGFRNGPEEARIYGPSVATARRAAGLSGRELATKVSASGYTTDAETLRDIEADSWRTVTGDLANALAGALGVEPRRLGDPDFRDDLLDRVGTAVMDAHDELLVARFEEPFGDRFRDRFLVAFLDLRLLLIVCENDEVRNAAIEFAVASVADADRYAVIAAVDNDADLTTWPVRPRDVLDRYGVPTGDHVKVTGRPPIQPTSLALGIGAIVEGEVVIWGSFEVNLGASEQRDITELRDTAGAEALKRIRQSATRVAEDRRDAFGSIGEDELANIQRVIDSVMAGTARFDALAALEEVERVS